MTAQGVSSLKVLVIDDSQLSRDVLLQGLQEIGFKEVVEASDGANALDLLGQMRTNKTLPQIILCDWNMPGMTGLEVLEACRAQADLKATPFIMVTAEAEQEFVIEAMRKGATDYVIKPVVQDVLARKIMKVVSKLPQIG